ncbi:carboxypeptidase-like regulatory domain-containing protein [Saltatorellus ferox]
MLTSRQGLAGLGALCLAAVAGLLLGRHDASSLGALGPVDSGVEIAMDEVPRLEATRSSLPTAVPSDEPSAEPSAANVEPPPAPSPRAGESVRFTVVDEGGVALAGAALTVFGDGATKEHLTDAEGSVELPSSTVAGALIRASSPGLGVDYAHPGKSPYAAYRLTLPPGASIRGRLFMADGAAVPEGVRVCALLQGQTDLDDRDLPRMAKLGFGCSTEVQDDGSFSIEGLEDGAMYQVTAFGGSVIVNEWKSVHQLIAPLEGLEVLAHYVGAVTFQIEAVTPEHARFLAAQRYPLPDLNAQRAPETEFTYRVTPNEGADRGPDGRLKDDRRVNNQGRLSLRLAELCERQRDMSSGLPERWFVASNTRAGAAVQGTFFWDLPFAEPSTTRFTTALATDEASIPVVAIAAPELPAGWEPQGMGSLEIAFEAPWLQDSALTPELEARVRLRPISTPHGESLTLAATWDRNAVQGSGGFVLPDVPAGSYEAWLFEDSSGASFPHRQRTGWKVDIVIGQRSQIDATDCGVAAVLVELFDPGGDPFERGLSAELLVKYPGNEGYSCLSKQSPGFSSAPYLFPFVPVTRTRGKEGLYFHPHNALIWPRPSLIHDSELTAGLLHRATFTVKEWPKLTRDKLSGNQQAKIQHAGNQTPRYGTGLAR